MKKNDIRHITQMAMLICIALILSYVETLLPATGIPGAKLGLSNIITLLAILILPKKDAFIILVIRVTISTLLFSSPMALAYSLSAGLVSLITMMILVKSKRMDLSIFAVSIIGAIVHNMTQLLVAYIILSTEGVDYLIPWLLIIAIPCGLLVGACVNLVSKRFINVMNNHS